MARNNNGKRRSREMVKSFRWTREFTTLTVGSTTSNVKRVLMRVAASLPMRCIYRSDSAEFGLRGAGAQLRVRIRVYDVRLLLHRDDAHVVFGWPALRRRGNSSGPGYVSHVQTPLRAPFAHLKIRRPQGTQSDVTPNLAFMVRESKVLNFSEALRTEFQGETDGKLMLKNLSEVTLVNPLKLT